MIVPKNPKARADLERQADQFLQAAHGRIWANHPMTHQGGQKVLSFNDDWHERVVFTEARASTVEEVEGVLDSLDEARLSRGEAQVTKAVLEGVARPGDNGAGRGFGEIAVQLGTTTNTARQRWHRAKRKIEANWAVNEDALRSPRTALSHSEEGHGEKLVIGRDRGRWGPARAYSEGDVAAARWDHDHRAVPDTDWKHQSSLTPDKWQLGDDTFWSWG